MSQNQLDEALLRRAVLTEGLKNSYSSDISEMLKQIDRYLRLELTERELSELSPKQLERWIRKHQVQIIAMLDAHNIKLSDEMLSFGMDEAQFTAKALETSTKVTVAVLAVEVVKQVITETPLMSGELVDDLLKSFTDKESKRICNEIRLGFRDGLTNSEIIRKLRGTKARNYQDGVLEITAREARTVTNTLTAHVASQTRLATALENLDIVDKVTIVSTLDSRTSAQCRAEDGNQYPLQAKYLPPYHRNCRTTYTLDLKPQYAGKGIESRRASKDGYVVNQTYYEWLKRQPKAFQEEVLGKSRAKLLRDGGLTAERFKQLQLDKNHKPRTLAEIKKLEPLAFERADIEVV